MQCKDFKCVYKCDEECEANGGECIGDMCENFGEYIGCQMQDQEECGGLRKK